MRKLTNTYVIIAAIIALCAVRTWMLPGGQYVTGADGTLSYEEVGAVPQTWQVFSSVYHGFVRQAGIIVFILVVYVASNIGFSSAFLNPFTVGIAQGMASLPLFSGMGYRIFCWGGQPAGQPGADHDHGVDAHVLHGAEVAVPFGRTPVLVRDVPADLIQECGVDG